MVSSSAPKTCVDLLDAGHNMRKHFADVNAQGVVEVIDTGQGADRAVGELGGTCRQDAALVDQHILDNANGGAQADAAR